MRGDHRVRERSDHERDIKQTNKAFIFNFKCDGKPLEGFKQGHYITNFEF